MANRELNFLSALKKLLEGCTNICISIAHESLSKIEFEQINKKKYQKIEVGDRPFCRETDTTCRMQHLDPTQLSLVIFPTSIFIWGPLHMVEYHSLKG